MSSFGMGGDRNGQRPQQQQPVNDTGNRRDAWNNPIEPEPEPRQRQVDNSRNPGGTGDPPNDDGIDENTLDTIWEGIKKKTEEPIVPKPGDPPAPDPKKQLEDYLVSVGLEPLTITDAEKEAMTNGDFSGILTKMNDKIRQSHIKGMSGSKTMIDAAVEQAVTRAMAGANSTFEGKMNLNALYSSLPFTKDKVIGPVAQTVMQKFLDRGASTEDAITGVKKFFAHTSDKFNADGVNKNRNGNYGGSRPNPTDSAPEGGWLSVLRGK